MRVREREREREREWDDDRSTDDEKIKDLRSKEGR